MKDKYFGKYRAIVLNNKDPEHMGRIRVQCPSVLGDYESAWCLPCVPIFFNSGGLLYIPSVGEVVWIEFEEGNPSKPIWVGGWWTPNNTPIKGEKNVEDKITLISRSGSKIEFDDKNKTLNISAQNINITSPNNVNINGKTIV